MTSHPSFLIKRENTKMSKLTNPRVKVTLPKRPFTHMIYRITIGNKVYIGCTEDLPGRANHHIGTKGRRVYNAFHNSKHDMIVEYVTGSDNYIKAKKLEVKHIGVEVDRVGIKNVLNVRHTKK